MTTAAHHPNTPPTDTQPARLPDLYRQLITDTQAHGIIGRPTAGQANDHRTTLGLPGAGPAASGPWTSARLERWRDHAVDHLDTTLLGPRPAPSAAADQARVVLALADIAVRDAWLIRFMRATADQQNRAADRLAALAPTAPMDLRAPIGTILALTEWTIGRDHIAQRLDWATQHPTQDYRLADLTRGLLDAGIPAATFTANITGSLTEADCRNPHRTTHRVPAPEAAGTALAHQGWALHVDTQLDLPGGVAWSGMLTHHTHPVASVSRHDPDHPPVLYFPPGSREQATWEAALRSVGVPLDQAISGLDHVTVHRPRHHDPGADPLNKSGATHPPAATPTPPIR